MAIDISTDLVITVQPKDVSTPTINGVYDSGSPPNTYLPGKDFSPIDGVSTGQIADFNFSIAFDSLSNQLYNLDKVYIQSVDDPRTDGTGTIPLFWINQDPNPEDITDDGLNTPVSGYFSNMSSIVFDSTANIKSDSTLTTGIVVTLPPNGFYWKTKIAPKIQVVAEKDGIKKVSEPIQLQTVRLSTAGNLNITMQPNGPMTYATVDGRTGFRAPFYISAATGYLPNIARILDLPKYDLVTYAVKYTASVNGTPIPLQTSDFSIPFVTFGELVSMNYADEILTITVRQTTASNTLAFNVFPFIPFNLGALTQATVTVSGEWNTPLPVITDFQNQYLFTLVQSGSTSQSAVVTIVPTPPEEKPIVQESINGALQAQSVFQALSFANYTCFETADSVFIRLIDSPIASFAEPVTPILQYYDLDLNAYTQYLIPANSYTALYAHYAFPASYDPNAISMQVLDGTIPLKTYAQLQAENLTANILAVTLTQDIFEQVNVDMTKSISFQFSGKLGLLTQTQFRDLYDANPMDSYPSYLYSYMSVVSCYETVEAAYEAVGDLLYTTDSFTLRNGAVYLNLGTTSKNGPQSVPRFNATSTVEVMLPFDTVDANLEYNVYTADGGYVTSITDYTKEYCLMVRWTTQSYSDNAYVNIPQGTVVDITLPPQLVPYLYLSGAPYILVPVDGTTLSTKIPIPNYSLVGNTLRFELPVEINLRPNDICIPIRFIIPSENLDITLQNMTFSKPLVYKQDPASLIYEFDTDSKMFKVNILTRTFSLRGAQQDTTGLSVTPTVYERGQSVTYMAVVNNVSYTPSSDYYMSMTVPTNQYNPVESSNNTLPAFIRGVDPKTANTTIYYQIQPQVTAQDILMMKSINLPGGPSLKTYYDTVIVNTWIKFVPGQSLPNNVVMMVSYTPGVEKGAPPLRVDYQVLVELPQGVNELYTNDAVFNYYSSGANLEAQSNMVQIRNRIAEPLPIIKAPTVQVKVLENGTPIAFTAYFTAPFDRDIFKSFRVSDTLHPALTFDPANTKVTAYPDTPLAFTSSVDPATNTAHIDIDNTAQAAGKLIVVTIATILTDTTKVTVIPPFEQLLIINTVDLLVNKDPALKSSSDPVYVVFTIPVPQPVPLTKAPQSQTKPLENGTPISFTLTFDAPADTRVTTSFRLTDTLHASLTPDVANMAVTAAGDDVPFTLSVDAATNTIAFSFANDERTAGKTVTVTVATTLADITKVPPSLQIENRASLILNERADTKSESNTVVVHFGQPEPPSCNQAVTDIIESVALEQTALSHILNAEGEKIQKMLSYDNVSTSLMLAVNRSVEKTVRSITRLEMILRDKLALFAGCLCENDCDESDNCNGQP